MTIRVPSRARVPSLCALGAALWLISSSGEAACLMKPRTAYAGIAIHTYMIAPKNEVAEYVSLGFSTVPCPADLSSYRDYVDRLCSTTPSRNMPVIDTVTLVGRSRDRACASARAGLAEAGS